ncbi:hypothetical protein [Synechococcus elongatus]|uniref:hypothetical protein n=1 Tax=Synechococcus elongatus TaxID=32046 RepID=UPI000313BDC8|nr:hypothetical protein [Synechococcus elongatus]AJD58891.1 hypothetical protein M744_08835 [Synechococcus elongatus UTEX 2973]MBD2588397.1 hypothetical protein [Synechococcus elongatus FACHB-242]MBD2689440.1 hypothetical protein [Synechococcus elongatus FACHB-1061]MBD2708141.1 hypothetical protein [Synechococcus elongatus PCC 7942 = FACHB-805]UOW71380.1 hypothetical protein PCC7943_1632 [Synechococcus elongatus PCC 7943]
MKGKKRVSSKWDCDGLVLITVEGKRLRLGVDEADDEILDDEENVMKSEDQSEILSHEKSSEE